MCDGSEFVHGTWNCVFRPGFQNPNGTIFDETATGVPGGLICQDAHAPSGIPWNAKHNPPRSQGLHFGYPDAPQALGTEAGRPDLADFLARLMHLRQLGRACRCWYMFAT